jgi:hypothetical protein
LPNIVALVEMPWRGEVEFAAELDDGDVVLVDRWYTNERSGHVDLSTFPSLIGTDIEALGIASTSRGVNWIRSSA